MEVRNSTNYLIDWCSSSENAVEDRKHYLKMLRGLMTDLSNLGLKEVETVFRKWTVYFVDVDEFARVNLDDPVTEL